LRGGARVPRARLYSSYARETHVFLPAYGYLVEMYVLAFFYSVWASEPSRATLLSSLVQTQPTVYGAARRSVKLSGPPWWRDNLPNGQGVQCLALVLCTIRLERRHELTELLIRTTAGTAADRAAPLGGTGRRVEQLGKGRQLAAAGRLWRAAGAGTFGGNRS